MDEELKKIGELIRTQNNRITDQPMFTVQQLQRDWGYDSDYADEFEWIDDEGNSPDEIRIEELDKAESEGGDTGGYTKVYFKDRWEFVTACFTEEGCKEYLLQNGHNLKKPRIFACGSYRNDEYQAVRNALINS